MRIIRFESEGTIEHGSPTDDVMSEARVGEGDPLGGFGLTDRVVKVHKLLAPIVPTDILCIGLNYHDHAAESGSTVPDNPMLLIKSSNTLTNPGDPILIPKRSRDIDYEAELAIVIAKDAKHVSKSDAMDYVLGYTCANDVTARDWQRDKKLGGGQFARGKSFDAFCPLGPAIVTKDEVPDPSQLRIRSILNGETMQDSTTADMIFDLPTLIESLSSTLTLRAGSVLLTGTPPGVGFARKPPVWLKAGDEIVVDIEGVGRLTNPVEDEA